MEKLKQKMEEEMLELELRYAKQEDLIYGKQHQIISGEVEPAVADCVLESDPLLLAPPPHAHAQAQASTASSSTPLIPLNQSAPAGLPLFWKTVLTSSADTRESVHPHDEAALDHLVSITRVPLGLMHFALTFTFAPNPFFSNKTLTVESDKDEIIAGDTIQWHSDSVNLTKILKQKTQSRGKGKHVEKRTVTVLADRPSFFNLFTVEEMPEDLSEKAEEAWEDREEEMFELVWSIKELLPVSVQYLYDPDSEEEDDDSYNDVEEECGDDHATIR
jgi:nucleosome assembly protein 1-like 1